MFHLFARGFSLAICLATLLLASPAVASEILIDSDRSGENISVYGDDVLRIVEGGIARWIDLHDSSKLVLDGGTIERRPLAWDTASIEVFSGVMVQAPTYMGHNRFTIYGGLVGQLTDRPEDVKLEHTVGLTIDLGATLQADVFGGCPGAFGSSIGSSFSLNVFDFDCSGTHWNDPYLLYTGAENYESESLVTLHGSDVSLQFATGTDSLASAVHNGKTLKVKGLFDTIAVSDIDLPLGDSDQDGDVDLDDLNSVRNHFGDSTMDYEVGLTGLGFGLDLLGNANPFDDNVGLDDLNAVRNNFGSSTNPVPEPPSATLAAFCGFALWQGRHRRKRRRGRSL